MPNPHKRTDDLFAKLLTEEDDPQTTRLLRGLYEVATLLVELNVGQERILKALPDCDEDED